MEHPTFDEIIQKIYELEDEIIQLQDDEVSHSCSNAEFDNCTCPVLRERLIDKKAALKELQIIADEIGKQESEDYESKIYD